MQYYVNENCIACGLCSNICPAVFHMDDDHAVADPRDVPGESEGTALEAMQSCPVNAIEQA